MKISVIDPTADERWDQFVANQAQGTIFHTSAWAAVIKEAYHYLPRSYILEDEAGQIRAAIPLYVVRSWLTGKRLICLPFSDSCCPLGNNAEDIAFVLNSIKNDIKAGVASYLEMRGWQNGVIPAQLELIKRDYHLSHLLDLEGGVDLLKEQFHHSIRKNIHQAEERGATVRVSHAEADMDYFYELQVATRKKLGVLPQPLSFFKALHHHVISQNLGFLAVAESEGTPIAGVVCLTYKDTIYYKFNASDEKYLKKRPNHLLIWELIQYACDTGYRYFSFGRCSPEDEGLRIFKSRWGAKERKSPYFYYPEVKGFANVPEDSRRYRAMQLFSRVMPEFVFRIAGSLFYRHLA